MNIEVPPEVQALGRNWPEQMIPRYDNYFKIWRSQFTMAPGTEENYKTIGQHWCAFANGKNLDPRLMLEWHLHVTAITHAFSKRQVISADRVFRYHRTAKKFLGWLKLMGVITHDPSLALPQIRKPTPLPQRKWEHWEYRRIIDYGSRLPHFNVHTWLTMLAYHTGMSLKDCCLLQWHEVVLKDDEPSYIEKPRAKMATRLGNKVTCTIPIIAESELWVWIKRLESRRSRNLDRRDGGDYVHQDAPVLYARQKPKASDALRRFYIAAIGSYRELYGRSFRNFRTSFCSRLVNSGADTVLVSKMTGHSRLEQLSDYVQPDIRAMQDAMVRALNWVEKDSGPDLKPRLILPSPVGQPDEAAVV